MALYTARGSHKPSAPRDVVAERYELCEDMASMLTEPAKNMSFARNLTETEVLMRCFQGLRVDAAAVTGDEAQWVIRRLAELLDWAQPNFADVE